jgi:3,4-dihydroxy 2-butanone 4-phosphate synthase/GTP cyclohydrolase II
MNDDGSMARLGDLLAFAARHDLKVGTIRDLIYYRRRHDRTIKRNSERKLQTKLHGTWRSIEYSDLIGGDRYLALVKGAIDASAPTLVRMHVPDILADACGAEGGGAGVIESSVKAIAEAGSGVIALIPASFDAALTCSGAIQPGDVLRDYGIGAQILADLGVTDMVLLTNSHPHPVGLSAYGLRIVGERPIEPAG